MLAFREVLQTWLLEETVLLCFSLLAIREGALSNSVKAWLLGETGQLSFSVLAIREGASEVVQVWLLRWTVWLYFSVMVIREVASEDCCSVYLVACLVTLLVTDMSALMADLARTVWLGSSFKML